MSNTTRTFHIQQTGSNLEFWRSLYTCRAMVISNSGYVHFCGGHGDGRDASLQSRPEDASTEDCLQMLRSVSAQTYSRLDLPGSASRIGFVAQEV